jgi:hypothetical protein
MLLRILRFGALRVADVMVPRADIIAVGRERADPGAAEDRSMRPACRAFRCSARRSMIRAAWCTSRT